LLLLDLFPFFFYLFACFFFFSSRRRHTRLQGDWSSDVCSSDLLTYWAEGREDDLIEPLLRPAYFVPETKSVDELLEEMQKVHVRSEERRVGKECRSRWSA